MVFLAHGFMRDLETMRGWAEHLASHGIPVTVPSLCNSTLLAGRHDRNADDLVAMADELQAGSTIYAGFSAGGLAALLAAAADPRAAAYVGLDPVDSGALARGAAVAVPATMFIAEPARCNAYNNIIDPLPDDHPFEIIPIPHARHCDFENPHDSRCERVCGSVQPAEFAEAIRAFIRAAVTERLLSAVPGSRR